MKPITKARKVVDRERRLVRQFLLDNLLDSEDLRGEPTANIYFLYCQWMLDRGEKTELRFWGFAKLLPSTFDRKIDNRSIPPCRVILGVRLG